MESNSLIPIGSEVNIYKSKIKTDLPQSFLNNLPSKITAKVIDYKITDANGIGYVLMTENKLKIWIFSNELNYEIRREYGINDLYIKDRFNNKSMLMSQYIKEFELNGNYKISYLLNPINFFKWSLYTFKDII